MKLEISYTVLKKMIAPGGLLPSQWSKVYWREDGAGGYFFYTGITGGFLCGGLAIDGDATDFASHKVSGNEVTSGGFDDGFALAARSLLSLI